MAAPVEIVHPETAHRASRITYRRGPAALLLAACWISTPCAFASEVPPLAYQWAAYRAGVPPAVLYAVALQESGTRLRKRLVPWPWTLNVAGTPQRYTTRIAACTGLHQALQRTPAHRIDAGLGQVNLGHQVHRYTQPCELLDPLSQPRHRRTNPA